MDEKLRNIPQGKRRITMHPVTTTGNAKADQLAGATKPQPRPFSMNKSKSFKDPSDLDLIMGGECAQ
jgi:hypothetical protein